ncbi:hypothetical protein ACN6KF_005139 [Labrys sp. La1]|uniref:hypothetical protein n=1 Tax=Labrys sp. La1 TaxID=3404917 RepID=UPI003EBA2A2C
MLRSTTIPRDISHMAAERIRSLIKEIVLTPENGELQIDVRGDLAGILAISLERKNPDRVIISIGVFDMRFGCGGRI